MESQVTQVTPSTIPHTSRFTFHVSRVIHWWASEGMRDARRLTVLPALISFFLLWPALLNQGVLAPTDIVASDPLTGGFAPGDPRPPILNPMLSDVIDEGIPWRLYARSE